MKIFYEVREINLIDCIADAGTLIRLAFADVADEFHLTPANCANSPAFLSDVDMLDSLRRPGAICFGAFQSDSNVLVGFAAIRPKGCGAYELTRLCVLPEHRHAGLGARLVQAAVQAAKERGTRRMGIGIIAENERLKAWYEGHGFRAMAEREYGHLPFRVCEMEREI